jgi:hypothetical protein
MGWLCCLQLLLALSRAIILGSESRGIHDHILLSQTRHSPNLESQVTVFISSRNRVAQLSPRHWVSFSSPPTTQGYGRGIRTCLHMGYCLTQLLARSRSLLPAASWHTHSWHWAPLGPMAIYLFNVKTFVFFSFR